MLCLRHWVIIIVLASLSSQLRGAQPTPASSIPDDFPRFVVPGHEPAMESLRRLFWLHYQPAGPLITLWDEWMPMSTLWPAMGSDRELQSMRNRWAAALRSRGMSAEGYVHTHQHDGLAHAEGWPFPLWTQAGGIGWHFRGTGVSGYDAPPATPEGWTLTRAGGTTVGSKGWEIELSEAASIIQTPAFTVAARTSPWLRLNWWAAGLEGANGYVEWTTGEEPEFSPQRRAYFSAASSDGDSHIYMPMGGGGGKLDTDIAETRTMIPVYRLPTWKGTITGLRLGFGNAGPAKVVLKSFHTACDSRHNINNANFIRGCHDYFLWSMDYAFLRGQIGRIRSAMRFIMREFDTRSRRCVYTTWPGHEGRSGVRYVNGTKQIVVGEGVGSNYWDLLPFGGEDALGTIYYYDALHDLAELEEQIVAHPEWCIATGADAFEGKDLRRHAQEVKEYGTERFWNPQTERFGTVDLEGHLHDYGFTFLNNEAVYYDFATPEQARSIHSWLAGERIVKEDTSQGPDIYHWRFGPRSTTRRNIDYYFWAWSAPESIPFGNQVQDGGGVLGFSYHDLMARLRTVGPDDAAGRLGEICRWFDETQAAGGYRAYYSDPARGTMQGGNVPGGLGLDKEFFESILVPQVMLYGFLGLTPTADGCKISPQLPRDWPSLCITRIHLHEHVLDVLVQDKTITVTDHSPDASALRIEAPPGWTVK
ncbi:MAG: glycosyl hydrolase family 65 protein [Pirellulaceae bacterium]